MNTTGADADQIVKFRDGDGLNCQRKNLKVVSRKKEVARKMNQFEQMALI